MSGSADQNTASQVSLNETLFKISQALDEEETHQIKYLLKDSLPKIKLTAGVKTLELFQSLEERKVISKNNTSKLQHILTQIGRKDLTDVLLRFHGDVPLEDSNVNAQASSSMSAETYSCETDISTEGMMSEMTNSLLHEALKSVGRIGGGTGFRVGSKYIMTASHVIKSALAIEWFTPTSLEEIQTQLCMQKLSIYFNINGQVLEIPLLKIAFFLDCKDLTNLTDDDSLDVTIAELECQEGYELPPPLRNFFNDTGSDIPKKMYFLGYHGEEGDAKIGFSWSLKQGEKLEKMKSEVSQRGMVLNEPFKTYIDTFGKSPKRVQSQGPFRQGGSGSPSLVIRERRASVFTILTHGYFNHPSIPDKHKVQEGPRMWYVKELMKTTNVLLSEDIFHAWDTLSSEGVVIYEIDQLNEIM